MLGLGFGIRSSYRKTKIESLHTSFLCVCGVLSAVNTLAYLTLRSYAGVLLKVENRLHTLSTIQYMYAGTTDTVTVVH